LNREAAERLGVPQGPLFRQLTTDHAVELPNGHVVQPADVISPPQPGRMLLYLGDYGDVDISRSIGREEVFCALDPTDTNQVETSHFFSFDRRFIYSFKCRHALLSFPEGRTHWLLYATHISRLHSMRTKIVKHICIFCKVFCKLSCLCKWVMHTQVLVRGFFSVGRTTHARARVHAGKNCLKYLLFRARNDVQRR